MTQTFGRVLSLFLVYQRAEGNADATVRTYQNRLSYFGRWASEYVQHELLIEDVGVPLIEAYMGALRDRMRDTSVASYIRDLKAFCRWASRRKHLLGNPFDEDIKVPRYVSREKKYIREDDFQKLCEACNPETANGRRNLAILLFMYDTGVRVGELCAMKAGDVDLPEMWAKVVGKGKRERRVNFGKRTASVMRRYRTYIDHHDNRAGFADEFFLSDDGHAMTPQSVTMVLQRLKAKTGVTTANPHSFRHAFGRNMVIRTKNVRAVQLMMGHQSVTTTEEYTRLNDAELAEIYRQASPVGNMGRRR